MAMALGEEVQRFPFLTEDEFALACHYLEKKYVQASLGQDRLRWRLRLHRALTTEEIYMSVAAPLDVSSAELDISLEALTWKKEDEMPIDDHMNIDIDAEDADLEALRSQDGVKMDSEQLTCERVGDPPHYSATAQQPYVVYEVHLHPTYQVPTLWFTLHDLPPENDCWDLETVYRYLVPDQFKSNLRAIGPLGGISFAPHPLTSVPAFFIHPCQTPDAMRLFPCSLKDYIQIWIGTVGGSVALQVPMAVAATSL